MGKVVGMDLGRLPDTADEAESVGSYHSYLSSSCHNNETKPNAAMSPSSSHSNTSGLPQSVPRYMQKTLSVSLPSTAYIESSTIRNAFSTGSIAPIKSLPSIIDTGTILEAKAKHIHNNLYRKPHSIFNPRMNNREFNPLIYQSNDYDKESKILKYNCEDERNNLRSSSRRPFLVTSHQFEKNRIGDLYLLQEFTEHGELKDLTRESYTDSAQFLYGSFHSTVSKSTVLPVKQPKQMDVQVWLKQVYQVLASDWAHLKFTLRYTTDNELLVIFESTNLPPANALLKYMNRLATQGVAASIGFTKRGDRWYLQEEDDHVVFAFYAPHANLGRKNVNKSVSEAHRQKIAARKS